MKEFTQWDGFEGRIWKEEINTRDFIQKNYQPYEGDQSFLADPTEATNKLWGRLSELQKEERAKGGVLDMDTHIVSGITAHKPGYISEELKELEQVVGLQTDKPLKRAFSHLAELRWQNRLALPTDMNQIQIFMRFLQNTAEPTIREYLMLIHRR